MVIGGWFKVEEIKNLNIAEEFQERDNKNSNEKMSLSFNYSVDQDVDEFNKEYQRIYGTVNANEVKIMEEFGEAIIIGYNVSDKIIETAYRIMDMSDNGFSYRDIEEYIVLILNCIKGEL